MPVPRRRNGWRQMADRPLIVFAGGGTGGHLFPAVAVAEDLRRLAPEVEVEFLVTDRPIDRQILDGMGWSLVSQRVRPFSLRPWHWPAFWLSWRSSVNQAGERMRFRRPAVVVGTGGYGAGPPIQAAYHLDIAAALLNPDALPGRANRHLGAKVDAVFCQWEVSAKHFPDVPLVVATGCPVRRAFLEVDRRAAYTAFGLDPSKKTLLVTGASQGARTVNQAVVALLDDLAEFSSQWQVLHLSGALDYNQVSQSYRGRFNGGVVLPFTDRMAEAITVSDLIVSRAGASTLAEITAVGRPSVLLPYPFHRDMHQRANAEVLARVGAAVPLEDKIDPRANAAQLRPVLRELMSYPERLARMGAEAGKIGRPDAGAAVARHLLEMAQLT
jgi:UDP-N-acetylglucosamine--N-acetylmuramyl-(pentapeptide) pyrophosphoryl-undecaprenol N-acetylglucosamine transferase